MKVSLCMIVRDEEANLGGCLSSVADLVDDLVIVDTGSTDNTKGIAQSYGARVFDFPWCDDFSAARNHSLSNANGDWVLWMDADDRVSPSNRPKLQALLAALPDTPDGFVMRCACASPSVLSRHEVDHIRLFRAGPEVRFRYRVHEQIAPAILRAGGILRATDIVIEHDGYRDDATYVRKQWRNMRLLDLACEERPFDPFMLHYRGLALLDLGRSAEALVPLILASRLAPPETATARLLEANLAEAYEREGMYEDAESTLCVARAVHPTDSGIAFAQALFLYRRGSFERAECELSAYFSVSANAARPDNFVGDPTIDAFRARHLRASLRYLLGRYAEAEEDARLVIDSCPAFGEGWLILGDALAAQGKEDELKVVLDELDAGSGGEVAAALLRASLRAGGGDRKGAVALLREKIQAGENAFLIRARDRLEMSMSPCAAHLLAAAVVPG